MGPLGIPRSSDKFKRKLCRTDGKDGKSFWSGLTSCTLPSGDIRTLEDCELDLALEVFFSHR
jgi:hypothetical protein